MVAGSMKSTLMFSRCIFGEYPVLFDPTDEPGVKRLVYWLWLRVTIHCGKGQPKALFITRLRKSGVKIDAEYRLSHRNRHET